MSTLPTFTTKQAREQFFRVQLSTSGQWAVRALEILYQYQTADEQAQGHTVSHNSKGFSGVHSEILSSFAERVKSWNAQPEPKKYPSPLSPKQLAVLFRIMPKYSKQLISHLESVGAIPPV